MALADSTRRQLIHMLAQKECSVSELAAPFDMSLAAVSKHIKVLESAGLIQRRKSGRSYYLLLRPEQLSGALDWISVYRRFWQQRLDALSGLIEKPDQQA